MDMIVYFSSSNSSTAQCEKDYDQYEAGDTSLSYSVLII